MKESNLAAILAGIMRIPRRAEQQNIETLAQTFVDVGPLLATLTRHEHQIMYGRRGAGKTHALAALRSTLEHTGRCVISLDLRTVGSAGGIYANGGQDAAVRASRLLIDVLEAIHNELIEIAFERLDESGDSTRLLSALDKLGSAATNIEVVGHIETEENLSDSQDHTSKSDIKMSVFPSGASLNLRDDNTKKLSRSVRAKVTGDARYTIRFGPLSVALRECVQQLPKSQLWILLDEWSAIPVDLQPILADLLRRAMFSVTGMVIKIAAIERRSHFSVRAKHGDYLGIELGADASQDINLDDYLVYDEGDDRAIKFLQDVLVRHVMAVAPELSSNGDEGKITPPFRMQDIFRYGSFGELVRAAEGIPRDFINIASLAAQRASGYRWQARGIDLDDVRDSARKWFLLDKEGAIRSDRGATRALANIVEFAVKRKKRSFLLDREYDARHDIVQDLYDARLIHLLESAVGPGARYDLFALDYGGYVDSIEKEDTVVRWYRARESGWKDTDPKKSLSITRLDTLTLLDITRSPHKEE